MSQLPGVGLVSISGGQKPAVRIQANPTAMASYALNLEICALPSSPQRESGQRQLRWSAPGLPDGANDQLLSSGDYAPLIIAYRTRPRQIDRRCRHPRRHRKRPAGRLMNQTPAVILNIQRQPGANIISVVDRIKQLLPQLTSSLPPPSTSAS